MELDEIKDLWGNMSQELERQKILTDKMVVDMTRQKYRDKLSSISIPETIGTIICFAMALFAIINFHKLDTWYLVTFGIISISFCIILPILSMRSIYNMKKIDISSNSYKKSLEEYARGKNQFIKVQKAGYYLGFIFALTVLPVAGKIMRDKDLLLDAKLWIWYIPLAVLFHFVFSKWVFKHYTSVTRKARSLLDEIKN